MYYQVRKVLGFSMAEWDELPWWQSLMYTQQMDLDNREQSWDSEKEEQPDELDPFEHMSGPNSLVGMQVDSSGRVGNANSLESMGIKVIKTTFGEQP